VSKQEQIPGTEPQIPAAILRQAHIVIEKRDEAELAKQRAELALEILHAHMAKADVRSFLLMHHGDGSVISFAITAADPVVKIKGYIKPHLEGPESVDEAQS